MKILIQNSKDERVIGLGQAIKKYLQNPEMQNFSGEVSTFDKDVKIYPLLQEFNIDVIIFEEDSGFKYGDIEYAREDYPNVKFVLIRNETHEAILKIKEGLFDFIFDKSNELPNSMEHVFNLKRRKLKYLVNEELVCGGEYKEEYETDFLLFTDYLDCPRGMEKSHKDFLDHLNWIGDTYNLKIYGPIKIDSPYYLGDVNKNEYKHIIASCKHMLMYTHIWYESAYINKKKPHLFESDFKEKITNIETGLEDPCLRDPDLKYKTYIDVAKEFFGELYK